MTPGEILGSDLAVEEIGPFPTYAYRGDKPKGLTGFRNLRFSPQGVFLLNSSGVAFLTKGEKDVSWSAARQVASKVVPFGGLAIGMARYAKRKVEGLNVEKILSNKDTFVISFAEMTSIRFEKTGSIWTGEAKYAVITSEDDSANRTTYFVSPIEKIDAEHLFFAIIASKFLYELEFVKWEEIKRIVDAERLDPINEFKAGLEAGNQEAIEAYRIEYSKRISEELTKKGTSIEGIIRASLNRLEHYKRFVPDLFEKYEAAGTT